MADADLELGRFGGRVNTDTGQLLTTTDVDRTGGMLLQSLCSVLSLLFFDDENGTPISGFPRDQLTTDHCKVVADGALGFDVSSGIGMLYNSAAAADEFGPARYLPVVLEAEYSGTLAAHHATLPRIDLVCIAPTFAADQAASRNVKNPTTGVVTSSSVAQRSRFSATVQVVAGTPNATPSAPAVPAGYMEIARAAVPATTGSAVWEDTRQPLTLGHYVTALPRHAHAGYVPLGGTDELLVAANSPAAQNVVVARGRAVINGVIRAYRAQTLTISAAHAALIRYDRVIARQNGNLDVVNGTAGAGVPAATPDNAVSLAIITVPALSATVTSGEIADTRPRGPIASPQVQLGSLTFDRMAAPVVQLTMEDGGLSGGGAGDELIQTLDLTVTYAEGGALPADTPIQCCIEHFLLDSSYSTTAGDFAEVGVVQGQKIEQAAATPPDWLFFLGTNVTKIFGAGGTEGFCPRMFFQIDDPTLPASVTFRRRESPGVGGTNLIHVYPLNKPGGGAYLSVTLA